jgi:hypothetical protein
MSLLDELEDARVTVVEPSERVIYAWFGGGGVNVYSEDGAELDYFTIGTRAQKLTHNIVRKAIERFIRYKRERDESR